MELILHRRNTIAQLGATDQKYGVEIDVRSEGGKLILQHDPFLGGESFIEWINSYKHGTLILNVKEEGLEAHIIDIMATSGINNYFFLDQSLPFLVKWSRAGEHRCAVRVSEFESIETALNFAGKVDWVWVDCFTKFPLSSTEARLLLSVGYKICLVSPELQGRNPLIEIPVLAALLNELNIKTDAVCTKRPDIWEKMVLPK